MKYSKPMLFGKIFGGNKVSLSGGRFQGGSNTCCICTGYGTGTYSSK